MNKSILKMSEPIKEREKRGRERRERRKEKGGKRRKKGRSKRERKKSHSHLMQQIKRPVTLYWIILPWMILNSSKIKSRQSYKVLSYIGKHTHMHTCTRVCVHTHTEQPLEVKTVLMEEEGLRFHRQTNFFKNLHIIIFVNLLSVEGFLKSSQKRSMLNMRMIATLYFSLKSNKIGF